jgi:hypothetical protein
MALACWSASTLICSRRSSSCHGILAALPWLGLDTLHGWPPSINVSTAKKEFSEFASTWEFNWLRIRSPFLGANGVKPTSNGALERMVYFGWVRESGDLCNVSTATKADEAEVDLSLWNVGNDGPGMEAAGATIRNWLHSFWRRSLTKQAACW